jgi:hypothetical protein
MNEIKNGHRYAQSLVQDGLSKRRGWDIELDGLHGKELQQLSEEPGGTV